MFGVKKSKACAALLATAGYAAIADTTWTGTAHDMMGTIRIVQ
jgi:hypothetical protein